MTWMFGILIPILSPPEESLHHSQEIPAFLQVQNTYMHIVLLKPHSTLKVAVKIVFIP